MLNDFHIKATKPVIPDKDAFINEISDIWNTGFLTNYGPKTERLKEGLKRYMGCNNLDLFVNGHSALFLAIKAMGFKKGAEIITSPFTFISTTNAIIQNDLVPVFGDIEDSYNLNPESIEELVTDKTVAIVTPHIFGIPCDVNGIEKIAKKYNLKVIYDGAQAFGTKIDGKSIGNFGDAVMFSFHAIKVFNSIEGGMIVYKDENLHRLFELYRNFGISYGETGTDVEVIGINAKMNEFQAAMGIVNLQGIDKEIAKRKVIADLYCSLLYDIEGIEVYDWEKHIDYNYAYFPIKVLPEYGRNRDELWTYLKEKGIGSRKLYDKLTCEYSCFANKGFKRNTRNADIIKNVCLDLPLYGTLKEEEIEYICYCIKKYKK